MKYPRNYHGTTSPAFATRKPNDFGILGQTYLPSRTDHYHHLGLVGRTDLGKIFTIVLSGKEICNTAPGKTIGYAFKTIM